MPSTLYVWNCTSGGSQAAEVSMAATVRPTCPAGQGSYVQVNVADMTATAPVKWDDVVWAFGAAILLWAVGAGVGMVINVAKRGRF